MGDDLGWQPPRDRARAPDPADTPGEPSAAGPPQAEPVRSPWARPGSPAYAPLAAAPAVPPVAVTPIEQPAAGPADTGAVGRAWVAGRPLPAAPPEPLADEVASASSLDPHGGGPHRRGARTVATVAAVAAAVLGYAVWSGAQGGSGPTAGRTSASPTAAPSSPAADPSTCSDVAPEAGLQALPVAAPGAGRAGWLVLQLCNVGSDAVTVGAVRSVVPQIPAVAAYGRDLARARGLAVVPAAAPPPVRTSATAAPTPGGGSGSAGSGLPADAVAVDPPLTVPAGGVGEVEVLLRADTCTAPVISRPLVVYTVRDGAPATVPAGAAGLPQQLAQSACGAWPGYVVTGGQLNAVRLALAGPPRLDADPAHRRLRLSVAVINPNDQPVTLDGLRPPSPGVSVQPMAATVVPPLVSRTLTATLTIDDCAAVFRFASWSLAFAGSTTGGVPVDTLPGPAGGWQDPAVAAACGGAPATPPASDEVTADEINGGGATGPLDSLVFTADVLVHNTAARTLTVTPQDQAIPGGTLLGVSARLGAPPPDLDLGQDPPALTRLVVPGGQEAWVRVRFEGFGCGTPRPETLPFPVHLVDDAGRPVTPRDTNAEAAAVTSAGPPASPGAAPGAAPAGAFRLAIPDGCANGLYRVPPLPPVYVVPDTPTDLGADPGPGQEGTIGISATEPLTVTSVVPLGPTGRQLLDRPTPLAGSARLRLPTSAMPARSPWDLLVTWTAADGVERRAVVPGP